MATTDGFSLLDRAVSNYLKGLKEELLPAWLGGTGRTIKHVVSHTMIKAPRFSVADLFGTEAFVVGSVSFLGDARTKKRQLFPS
jgi:hypothetical protein